MTEKVPRPTVILLVLVIVLVLDTASVSFAGVPSGIGTAPSLGERGYGGPATSIQTEAEDRARRRGTPSITSTSTAALSTSTMDCFGIAEACGTTYALLIIGHACVTSIG